MKVNCMVTSWILNSMAKEIIEAFIYATSIKNLRDELAHKLEQNNGPFCILLRGRFPYSIKKTYMWWHILQNWRGFRMSMPHFISICSCGASKELVEIENKETCSISYRTQ